MRSLTLILLAGYLALIPAAGYAETWIVGTAASWHYSGDDNSKYEQQNWGVGIEHSLFANTRAVAGMYRNSNRRDSLYVGLAWSPLRSGNWRLGTAALLVSGYETTKDPELVKAVFPVISWEGERWGINIPIIPATQKNAGAIGLQIKVRF